jgi:bacterioferritin-associated ferredoxin
LILFAKLEFLIYWIAADCTNYPLGYPAMIVCSCNVLTDHDVRSTLTANEDAPRTTGQVYHCLGCSAQCGRCARTIRRIMNEALATAEPACCRNTPDRS